MQSFLAGTLLLLLWVGTLPAAAAAPLVLLDARDPSAGSETWINRGSLGPFHPIWASETELLPGSRGVFLPTRASYNTQGYLASIIYPGNTGGNADKVQFTQYDNDGNCLKRIDGNGVETDFVFNDPESLLTNINYPATPALDVSLSYDGYGRRQGMTDSTGSVSYSWDDDSDLTQVATTYTGLPQRSISYTLNPDGSRATMVTPAGTFSYLYENDGRLSSLTNPYSETSGWSYLDNGWLQKQTLGNGANANWTYNARGFVTRLQNLTSSSATLSDFGGTGGILSDSLGNPTSLPANVPGSTAASGTTTYTYNTQDELTQEQSARNGSYTNSFGYDAAFNPTTWKGSTQTFNSDNQNSAFVFDGNGNPTSYNGNTLSFDPENRLTAYGSLLTAGYNGDDLRAWKQNSSGRTYFLYDGADPVVEMDGSGNVTAVNTFGAAGLVSRHTSTGSTFYTFDTQGRTVERLDSSQNVLSTDVWDAFGKLLSGPASDPWGYEAQDGYFTDTESGLISLSFRYYDPEQGRFLNRDPIGFDGGINLYGYVGNDSPAGSDSLGLMAGPVPIEGVPMPGTEGRYPPTPDLGFWGTARLLGPMLIDYKVPLPAGALGKIHGFFPWLPGVETGPVRFHKTTGEMNDILGKNAFKTRNHSTWNFSKKGKKLRIQLQAHPEDNPEVNVDDAPEFHTNDHYHIDCPDLNLNHARYRIGEPIPNNVLEYLERLR